ncbi:MAG: divergent polysaccharide deacetylase family protein [Rhodospirillales bacterium]|nr:divergent polysaccharide deacetylase family protein [Rhodospirillales bacterium]
MAARRGEDWSFMNLLKLNGKNVTGTAIYVAVVITVGCLGVLAGGWDAGRWIPAPPAIPSFVQEVALAEPSREVALAEPVDEFAEPGTTTNIHDRQSWMPTALDQPRLDEAVEEVAIAPAPQEKPDTPSFDNLAGLANTEYGPDMAYAVEVPPAPDGFEGRPMIAIMIDDLGLNRVRAERVAALPGPLTMAFIPYGGEVADLVQMAAQSGHEIFLHLPMEPLSANEDPGPHALLTGLDAYEFRERLTWNLERFDGYVGVNNHMGSRLTQDVLAMGMVMAELRGRGLVFVDSVTSAGSVAYATARQNGIPATRRDVFLDNMAERDAVLAQLARLEDVARRQGFALGIGHPHDATVQALAEWLPIAEQRGFVIVPATRIIEYNEWLLAQRASD